MKQLLRKCLALGMVAVFACAGLPATATAGEDAQAVVFEAVRAELRAGPWVLEEVSLGESEVENRGIMTATSQRFTASVRARVPRFQVVDESGEVLFLELVADPDRITHLEGDASILTGPGITEVEIAFADPGMVRSPGEILARLDIRDRIVLIVGTAEADEAMALLARQREAEMARFLATFGGDWAGMKSCRNGVTEVRLSLQAGAGHRHLAGTVSFQTAYYDQSHNIFSMGEGFTLPSGSFTVTARFDERIRRVRFRRDAWLDEPARYSFDSNFNLGVEGTGDDAMLIGTDQRSCEYRLMRPDVFAAEREPYLAPFRALLEAVEPGTWIESIQIGPVDSRRDGQHEWPLRVRVESVSGYHIAITAEMTVFRRDNGSAAGEVQVPLVFVLTEGVDRIRSQSGMVRLGSIRLRNIYMSNQCPGALHLEDDTIVMSGPGAENRACMEEMRFKLVPPS